MKEAIFTAGVILFLAVAIFLVYEVASVPFSTLPATVAVFGGFEVPYLLIFISVFSLITILLLTLIRMLH